MITALSRKISQFLYRKGIIEEGLKEVYEYGFETIFSTVLGFLITVAIGAVFRMTLLSLFYYVIFVTIRQFTGGYHADTHFKCNLIFAVTTVLIFAASRVADMYAFPFWLNAALLILSTGIIWLKAPIENEAKELTEEQKKRNHLRSIVFSGLLCIVSLVFYKRFLLMSSLIAFTLVMVAVMIIVALLIENKKERRL